MLLIRNCLFMVGVYEEGFCVSMEYWPEDAVCGIDD
jgi:hypothetical protein